jgi:hypothetical protein
VRGRFRDWQWLFGQIALAAIALILCGCGKADEAKRPGSAEQFSLKDYLCTITPTECHRKEVQRLFLAPPDAIYEATLGGKALHIPMGYVHPIQAASSGELRDQELFLNALGPEMQPRSIENIREFIRNGPQPALVRFNVMSVKSVGSPQWWEGTVDESVKDHIQRLTARKRYPDKYGLQHWGVDYTRSGGDGADTLANIEKLNKDVVQFASGITADQLWFRQVGNNLEVSIIGTEDKLTLNSWYAGSGYQVEEFRTSDGHVLIDTQVQNLVQAMASFVPPAPGQTTLPQAYQNSLAPLLAADWR